MVSPVLAAVAGATIVGGACLIVAGLVRQPVAPPRPPGQLVVSLHRARARLGPAHLIAIGAGVVVLAITGLLGVALATTAIGLVLPLVLRRGGDPSIERLEALEEWTRHLADLASVPGGLEQVLTSSARAAPAVIEQPVRRLGAQLQGRIPVEDALRDFADDLGDYSGDLLVATLLVAARRRGSGLREVLTRAADALARRVEARRRIESDRARPRATARGVTIATLVAWALIALNPSFAAPYGTAVGQLVLLGLVGAYIAVLLWLRRMAYVAPEPRFLVSDERVPA